jgi:hypothetical protein
MNGYSFLLGLLFGGRIYKSVELYEPQRTQRTRSLTLCALCPLWLNFHFFSLHAFGNGVSAKIRLASANFSGNKF